MVRNIRPLAGLMAGAVVCALVISGCGGDDAAETTTTEAPSVTVADTSPTTDTTATTEAEDPEDETTTTDAGEVEEVDGLCVVLTQAEAEAILGEPLEPGRQNDDECEWETADEDRSVTIERSDVGGYDYEDLDQWRELHQSDAFEPVEDVGDEAYFGVLDSELSVLIGEEVFNIAVVLDEGSVDYDTTSDKAAEIEAASEIARQIAERL